MTPDSAQFQTEFHYDALHRDLIALRGKQLFFIGGAPKSGTTWLQLLLNAHPEIACAGEGNFMNVARRLIGSAVDGHNSFITDQANTVFADMAPYPLLDEADTHYLLATAIGLSLCHLPGADQAATRAVGEKTPSNLLHFDLLHRLFPRARLIHVVRDPRDVAVSAWFQRLRISPEEITDTPDGKRDFLMKRAAHWARLAERATLFEAAHPDVYLAVRYEDLLDRFSETAQRVFGFLGVAANDELARHCAAQTDFATLAGGRKAGDEDRASFFRQGRAGDWRNHMDDALCREFADATGAMLSRYGYGI